MLSVQLQSIISRFVCAQSAAGEFPPAWAPIFLSKLFDAPLPLPLRANILRVIASMPRSPGVGHSGLEGEQRRRFVDQSIEVLGRSTEPTDLQAFARACVSVDFPSQLQTVLPLLVVIVESQSSSAEMLCDVVCALTTAVTSTVLRPLLLQFGVIAALVRRCLPHPDPQVPQHTMDLFNAMLFFSHAALPFDDAMIQSGILLEGRLAGLVSRTEHKRPVLILLHLQNRHALLVQPVVLECLAQLIPCLSSPYRTNVELLLIRAVENGLTPEQRSAFLAAQTMQHLLRVPVPAEFERLLEPTRHFHALRFLLGWEECVVASNVLHPIAEAFVQTGFVPILEEIIQATPERSDVGLMVSMARFLAAHVYNRLPVGLVASQPHLGLTRQASLTRRSCAAAQPQWFAARLQALEDQLLQEEMRLQQADAAEAAHGGIGD